MRGVYDLTLHNYGPTQVIGSLHVELPDEMKAREIHRLTRMIATDVYQTFGIVLTVGIYASNDTGEDAASIRSSLDQLVKEKWEVLQVHGFYLDNEQKTVSFDLVIDFKANREQIRDAICGELTRLHPGYRFIAVLDSDYSD